MTEEPERISDVGQPRPPASSKPIIVGHHPSMPDPMVKRQHSKEPALAEHAVHIKPVINVTPPPASGPEANRFSDPLSASKGGASEPTEEGPPALFPKVDHSSYNTEPLQTSAPPTDAVPQPDIAPTTIRPANQVEPKVIMPTGDYRLDIPHSKSSRTTVILACLLVLAVLGALGFIFLA